MAPNYKLNASSGPRHVTFCEGVLAPADPLPEESLTRACVALLQYFKPEMKTPFSLVQTTLSLSFLTFFNTQSVELFTLFKVQSDLWCKLINSDEHIHFNTPNYSIK